MEKIIDVFINLVVKLLKKVFVLNVNSTCFGFTYQHKLPKDCKKYRKF